MLKSKLNHMVHRRLGRSIFKLLQNFINLAALEYSSTRARRVLLTRMLGNELEAITDSILREKNYSS